MSMHQITLIVYDMKIVDDGCLLFAVQKKVHPLVYNEVEETYWRNNND